MSLYYLNGNNFVNFREKKTDNREEANQQAKIVIFIFLTWFILLPAYSINNKDKRNIIKNKYVIATY